MSALTGSSGGMPDSRRPVKDCVGGISAVDIPGVVDGQIREGSIGRAEGAVLGLTPKDYIQNKG